ncbi:FAD-dependent pyridine nucleotide-disulfide oxidoreductase (plasmid) [Emticicia oligotrophica DSM 17448]|uniref:FAD-dependent pyridine nucleotide-disulfide oxidoreductase n=1 Tax=Emticicia oligotrophica (strain DSM 17448 / CIP 109782 / MTCC 6937 / GPTSA100-15) TaxID=929562 RepID=A0ABN4AUR8_EMTOG|nr:NAD(P)-binding domain-containing protein [Emticicia oligotrophica]AFK05672.1 FAD-dependent pyridine nucleotide-disulfide oxidoreductase [Emticicia oligotrophica DSM 17448]
MNLEEILIYGVGFLLCGIVMLVYLKIVSKKSKSVQNKIEKAKEEGIYEPVSLFPFIDPNACIGSGACVAACPEKDIIGIVDDRAELVNASNCVGHGACFHACPVEAISLKIGTEKRGVDLPHVNQNFETNVKGIFIAGELGGMGLIKNSVEQGKQAVDNIYASMDKNHQATYDLVIIGAGPAGISASLQAKKLGLKFLIVDQDSLGGTVFNFPRAKVVMTSPMDLPLHGKVKLFETSKTELLELWQSVTSKNDISIVENCKIKEIVKDDKNYVVVSETGTEFITNRVLLAIGRRGSPRKLNVVGEELEKVAYRLLEPELIQNKHILVVGGGDSAIENALLLAPENQVTLSYRSENFNRLKPKNLERIKEAIEQKSLRMEFSTQVQQITPNAVILKKQDELLKIPNDLVYIFAGGELPTEFLKKSGIEITKRFGYIVKSHK